MAPNGGRMVVGRPAGRFLDSLVRAPKLAKDHLVRPVRQVGVRPGMIADLMTLAPYPFDQRRMAFDLVPDHIESCADIPVVEDFQQLGCQGRMRPHRQKSGRPRAFAPNLALLSYFFPAVAAPRYLHLRPCRLEPLHSQPEREGRPERRALGGEDVVDCGWSWSFPRAQSSEHWAMTTGQGSRLCSSSRRIGPRARVPAATYRERAPLRTVDSMLAKPVFFTSCAGTALAPPRLQLPEVP